MRHILPLVLLLTTPGCISAFDASWYSPEPLTEYSMWNNEVPEEYIEWLTLESPPVGDEDEASQIIGVWLHQCLSEGDCASPERDGFDAARQDKTILYLHGNLEHLDHYWDRVQMLWNMGYRVFAIDYRGYGMSTGTPSEDGVFADGQVALEHVIARMVEEDPALAMPDGSLPPALLLDLGIYGYSLGSTIAIDLASKNPPKVLVTETALASAQAFLDHALGVGFHSSVLMNSRFDNVGKIPDIVSPTLIAHGMQDNFVAFDFATVLYEAAQEPKSLYPVEQGKHSNVPCPTTRDTENSPEIEPCFAEPDWLERVGGFLDENLP